MSKLRSEIYRIISVRSKIYRIISGGLKCLIHVRQPCKKLRKMLVGKELKIVACENETITEKWDREAGDSAWALDPDMGDR